MKNLLIFCVLILTNLYADENWIKIKPIIDATSQKSNTKLNANSSQRQSINKIIRKVSIVKELLDGTKEKEKQDNKNWFAINIDTH